MGFVKREWRTLTGKARIRIFVVSFFGGPGLPRLFEVILTVRTSKAKPEGDRAARGDDGPPIRDTPNTQANNR